MPDPKKFMFIGRDVYIAQSVIWKRPNLASVGSHIAIDDYTVITTAVELGSYIHIHCLVSIIGGEDATLWMGNFTTIAAGCRIICKGDAHLGAGLVSPVIPKKYRDDIIGKQIVMEDYSSLGSNVVIMPNVEIAEGVVIGANSLVTRSITKPWSIWAGSPVRYIKDRPSEKMKKFGEELIHG